MVDENRKIVCIWMPSAVNVSFESIYDGMGPQFHVISFGWWINWNFSLHCLLLIEAHSHSVEYECDLLEIPEEKIIFTNQWNNSK